MKYTKTLPFFLLLLYNICSGQTMQKSLLWKVSGNGIKSDCYIFGTFHLGVKPNDKTLAQYDSLINLCEAFYGEMNFDSVNQKNILKHAFLKGRDLESCFKPEDYQWASKYLLDSLDIDISDYKKFKPAFIQTMLAAMELMKSKNVDDKSFSIDQKLFSLAKANHKILRGLETDEMQAAMLFDETPVEKQATNFIEGLKKEADDTGMMNKLLMYYKAGDLENLNKLANEPGAGIDMDILLDRRNKKWVEIFVDQASKQSMFIAVGALHLPGNMGLLNLLTKRGYRVTAVILK
ncbi:MAG: TraB/GumN family protein [Bacteroidota bacterium]|nr:TraB/GumN family protein [Bacteroidota bacterium]